MVKKTLTRKQWNNIVGWSFALPAIAGFFLLNLIPMIYSFYYSLTDYNFISKVNFVGLQNYVDLFTGADETFKFSVKATSLYALMAIPANLIFSFMIAMLLNRKMIGRSFFRSVFYLPSILPAVASSFVWILLMNPDFGLFNTVLENLNLPTSQYFWAESSVLPSIVFMGVWGTGSTQVIFLAGLQNISQVYYEAAEIDGANAIAKFFKITLPMVSSTLFFNLVMGIIGALQVFGQAYIITSGGPNNASLFYVYNIWRKAFTYREMGLASAMGWILFVVCVLATVVVFKTSNKWVYYEGENG